MTELDIRIRGPQGAGKTSLMTLLAYTIAGLGKVVRYQNEKDERATVIIDDPAELARATAGMKPVEDIDGLRSGASRSVTHRTLKSSASGFGNCSTNMDCGSIRSTTNRSTSDASPRSSCSTSSTG
jgi:ABC-type phosphonate transport system ATPase subunit